MDMCYGDWAQDRIRFKHLGIGDMLGYGHFDCRIYRMVLDRKATKSICMPVAFRRVRNIHILYDNYQCNNCLSTYMASAGSHRCVNNVCHISCQTQDKASNKKGPELIILKSLHDEATSGHILSAIFLSHIGR